MLLNDKIDFYGVFSFKSFDKNGNVLDEYTEKNLIMDRARTNMAQLVAGVTSGNEESKGMAIDRFVLGTQGHVGTDILKPREVGLNYDDGEPVFDATLTQLYSEANSGINYSISFDVNGGNVVEDSSATGIQYNGGNAINPNTNKNTVKRVVDGKEITYTFTIPVTNANGNATGDLDGVVAYTEAALYAGGEIFSMKTFPARVKEDSVQFVITWSIIF